ncbi:unnamed protein product [Caenorhabditis angaria]|uniref:BTB domain-containing protein n=1 Tax=Caenorhabditis angaria TaxID=860376 RepID=A0A9P1IAK8_9PELO|nr:unnamed protein product [Caenorhabditis angaria]
MHPTIEKSQKLRLKVEGIRELGANKIYSAAIRIGDQDWKLASNIEEGKFNIFLVCETNSEQKNWLCEVNAEVSMLKQIGNGSNLTQEFIHHFDFNNREKKVEFCKLEFIDNGFEVDKNVFIEIEFDYKFYNFAELFPNYIDRLISVEEVEFKVNKMQLASASEYFYDLFVTKDSTASKILLEYNSSEFMQFLAAIQPNSIEVTASNYQSLMRSAQEFRASFLHYKIEHFLIWFKDLELFEKLKLADKYNYTLLRRFCVKSIDDLGNIKIISMKPEFENLSTESKFRILRRGIDIV